ncbi:MAG: restriction endonuclease subunit R [Prevotella melaninogenica]
MNKNLWNYYKQSEDGKNAIDIFNPETENIWDNIGKIIELLKQWDINENLQYLLDRVVLYNINLIERGFVKEDDIFSREFFEHLITTYDIKSFDIDDNENIEWREDIISQNKFRAKASTINALSLFLYSYDSFFTPILLSDRFDLFQKSCDTLGIELPPIPHTTNYKEYLMYYYDICVVLNAFQQENELSDAELCACIYDYGMRVLQETSVSTELPQPTNIWLTGGGSGKDDFAFLDSLGNSPEAKNSIWACNEKTRKGDIVIMYCTSPRSYIHSVWCAGSTGIFNPFDYYHCRTTIQEGIRLPEITFNDLKNDEYFSNLPIVRKNLQGINGVAFSAKDYSELLRLAASKGAKTDKYPQLFIGEHIDFGEIKLEKDVEEKILIPILKKFGYIEDDWTRQLQLKAGRKEKAIPDFVFFPKGEKHFENAPFIIEAKLDMSSILERQKAFRQALSYARMLRSKLMGICDKERLMIYRIESTGSCNIETPLFDYHWQAIYSDNIIGAKLVQCIGKEVVESL